MENKTKFSKQLIKGSGKLVASLIFTFIFVIGAYAQNPVSWSLSGAKTVKAGVKFDARLSANINGGWYLYFAKRPFLR